MRLSIVVAGIILLIFTLARDLVLSYFGITIDDFCIAREITVYHRM